MKHFIYTTTLVIALTFCDLLQAQTIDNKIVIGAIDSIQSTILNEERKLWIYIPNSEPGSYYSKQKYPVIYLLDGPSNFYSMVGLVDFLGRETVMPKMIIVGIDNTDRWRDLTPTKWQPDSTENISFPPSVGGGEGFTSFLEKELIPYIDSKYPTAPYRMMIGHSLGGLMVINTLLHHSHLFNSYVAIDPSLWWDDELMIKQADSILQQQRFERKSLYLAMANNTGLPKDIDIYSVLTDTTESAIQARNIVSFANALKTNDTHDIHWKFKFYPDEYHPTVPLIAEFDATRFIFDKYNVNMNVPFLLQLQDPALDAETVMTTHFKMVSEHLGYTILPPEHFVNQYGYGMMQANEMDKAFKFFGMNVRNYPNSFNVYDSMGDYYVAMNDKENAIIFYSKALELKEVPAIRKKLEELKN